MHRLAASSTVSSGVSSGSCKWDNCSDCRFPPNSHKETVTFTLRAGTLLPVQSMSLSICARCAARALRNNPIRPASRSSRQWQTPQFPAQWRPITSMSAESQHKVRLPAGIYGDKSLTHRLLATCCQPRGGGPHGFRHHTKGGE